jgi:hypothetical protein
MYNRLKRHLTAHKVSGRQLPDKIVYDRQHFRAYFDSLQNIFIKKTIILCAFFVYIRHESYKDS